MKYLDILLAKCQHILNTTQDVRSDTDRVMKILAKCHRLYDRMDNSTVKRNYGWAILGTAQRHMDMFCAR